jgi:SAM-dependent methyltransferase
MGVGPAENWFERGGDAYARSRPDYPPELAAFLASIAPDTRLAIDVGCGNGQLTCLLAAHFDQVIGIDPSRDQIANAVPHDRVRYLCAPAEDIGLPEHRASLITAAQAAHWFDLPRFYGEVAKVAGDGAILALVSYGIPEFEPDLNPRFLRFYRDEIGPYWPPERRLVETGYVGISFPFAELPFPAMEIRRDWDLDDVLRYVSTWSATRRVEQAGREDIVTAFADDLTRLWGNGTARRRVRWPITMRLGRVGG